MSALAFDRDQLLESGDRSAFWSFAAERTRSELTFRLLCVGYLIWPDTSYSELIVFIYVVCKPAGTFLVLPTRTAQTVTACDFRQWLRVDSVPCFVSGSSLC